MTFGALCAQGAEVTAQAIVLTVKGPVTVLTQDGKTAPMKAGDKLSVGAVITTGPDGSADIQVFNGAVATIRSDTTCSVEKLSVTTSGGVVTKQTGLLNLKVGTIASNIDPANHNINDYGIRTPKGVAAARGTSYVVNVNVTGKTQVFVITSAITFTVTNPTTGQVVSTQTLTPGDQVTVSPTGVVTVVKLTGQARQDAIDQGKPVDPNNVTTTTTGDTNTNGTPQGNNSNNPVILDVTSPSS